LEEVKMRIVITGSAGQLGHELQRVFCEHDLLLLDLPDVDITDYRQVLSTIPAFRPDLIIHGAAMTHVDRCETEPDSAYRINALGTQNVALAAARVDAPMIYVSTDYVFDGTSERPYLEWDPPNPQSVYGKSKLAGEYYVQSLLKRFYIVRTAWLYSRTGNNFVKSVLRLASERSELHYVTDEIGSPTYASDLAVALKRLAASELYGIYHLTNSGVCSRFEFAKAILELAGRPQYPLIPTQGYARPAKVPARSELRNYCAATQLGITLRPWHEALVEYFREP
jgi:dTDP-4-dehydrorhamnose reductase